MQSLCSSRQPFEDHILNEMIIAENVPLIHHADRIIEKSLNEYWKDQIKTVM